MEVKPGFKQTEVGVIPEHWELTNLVSISREPMQNGVFNKPSLKGAGVKLINVGDLYTRAPIDLNALELFDASEGERERFKVENGDLFFTRSSVVPSGIAHCNLYRAPVSNQELVVFDSHVIRLRPDIKKVVPSYLFRFCVASVARHYLVSHAKTGTMTTIDQEVLGRCPVILPPVAEQSAIAEAFGDTDMLIESLEQLLAKKRFLKQGAMQELLTGKRRLPEFKTNRGFQQSAAGVIPKDWSLDSLVNLACVTTGGKNTQDRVEDGLYPFFVRSQNVERINSYSYDGEAVLTAGDGVGTGRVFHYVSGKFDVHQRVYRISDFSERICGFFFFLYFSKFFYSRIMQMTAKSSVDSVRREMISKMLIPLPTKVEQEAIAAAIRDIEDEISALEEKLEKIRLLKQGMMQELLTGRTRLT